MSGGIPDGDVPSFLSRGGRQFCDSARRQVPMVEVVQILELERLAFDSIDDSDKRGVATAVAHKIYEVACVRVLRMEGFDDQRRNLRFTHLASKDVPHAVSADYRRVEAL